MLSRRLCETGGVSPAWVRTKVPVPKVALVSPAAKQAWPIAAACWSPAMPQIGMARAEMVGSVVPSRPALSQISGRRTARHAEQIEQARRPSRRVRSISAVREALVASLTCSPPVSRKISQLSIVPMARLSPASAVAASGRAPSGFSSR